MNGTPVVVGNGSACEVVNGVVDFHTVNDRKPPEVGYLEVSGALNLLSFLESQVNDHVCKEMDYVFSLGGAYIQLGVFREVELGEDQGTGESGQLSEESLSCVHARHGFYSVTSYF